MRTWFPTLICVALLSGVSALAQTSTWSGVTDGNFSTSANWDIAPVSGYNLAFPIAGANRTITLGSTSFSAGTISFAGTSSYTLSGSGATLSVGSSISSTTGALANVNVSLPVALTAASAFSSSASDLIFSSVNNGGYALTLSPNNNGANHFVILNGALTGSGALIVSGTGIAMVASGSNTWGGGTTINNGATLQVGDFSGNVGSISLPGDVTDNGRLQIKASTGAFTYTGNISGTGNFLSLGSNTITLNPSTANTYQGGTNVGETSTLEIGKTNALPTGTSVFVNPGATLKVSNSQTIDRLSGGSATAGGVTIAIGKTLTVAAAGATQTQFEGKITGAGALVINGASGSKLDLTSTTSDFTGGTNITSGQLNLNSNAVLGAGPVTVGSGGTLAAKNGYITGAFNVSGKLLALPSLNITGATTFNGGATIGFALADANGTAGTTWSLLNMTGGLDLSSATSSNKISIALVSYSGTSPGLAANFDTTQNYSFTLAKTTAGITGFNAAAFAFDFSQFTNTYTGTWALQLANGTNDLVVAYTGASAIPEPSAYAAIAALSAGVMAMVRRRRK